MIEADAHEPEQKVSAALRRWSFGFEVFQVVGGVLEEGFRRALTYCAIDLVDEPAVVLGIWKKAGATKGAATTIKQGERFVLEVDQLVKSLGVEGRTPAPSFACNECFFVGEPKLAWTRLGDDKDYLGRWCRSCRRSVGIVELTDDAISWSPPPWVWLNYDRKLPEPGDAWPVRRGPGVEADFPFGANERTKT